MNTLKLDVDSIADFQKEYYNVASENELIGTRFSLDFEKRTQSNHIKMKLDQIPVREGEVVYTASKKFDYLWKLAAHVSLFPIRVKDKYSKTVEICYHHNLGHNIFTNGECKIDGDHFGTIDSIWMDIHSSCYIKKKELYNRNIGNIPCLTEWGTELPGIPLIVDQPFSFGRRTQVSLPLWKSPNNTINFEYKLRTKLVDLLRMRVLKNDGTWKEVRCNLKYLEYKSDNLPIPEMWGRYGLIKDDERNWRKSPDELTGEPVKQTIYIEDVDMTSSKNPKTIGTTDIIPLETPYPAKHIFWVAGLVDGNHSNYTTNRSDVKHGWNPCARSGITYGGSQRVEQLGYEHFTLSEFEDFEWPNYPKEEGYNVFTYTFDPVNISHSDNAVVLKECNAQLVVSLGDTNPFLQIEQEDEETDENGEAIPIEALENDDYESYKKDRYNIHVRTIVTRKLEVYWDDKAKTVKYVFV